MVKKKYTSKRISLKDKYKIQRRVVESHRKSRKQSKKDKKAGIVRHDKTKKDPGIPNSWPFKQELLQEVAKAREKAEQKKLEMKQKRKEAKTQTMEELMAQANQSRAEFDAKQGSGISSSNAMDDSVRDVQQAHGQQSRRAYLRELKKVIDASDVLLQILDARDPVGTRISTMVENTILSHYDKRMVLVLNKIDLIPKDAVQGWLTVLRRSHPTVAMKAGTNQSRSNETKSTVGRAKGDGALQSASGVGVEGLLQLLKNYARSSGEDKKSKSSITVGIIGYPNVGKSSILNTLKRSRAVGVSPRPGFTTSMQEVVLDRNVRLLDSPGVVFDDENVGGSHTMLRNCVDADSVDDPIPAVQALVSRCSAESLMMTYSLPAFPKGDVMIFLSMVARQYGKVLKGGIPDKVLAARSVLRDWNSGKIPYYTPPPTTMDDVAESRAAGSGKEEGTAKIVSSFGAEFDVLAELKKMDDEVMKDLGDDKDEMDFVKVDPVMEHEASKADREAVNFLTGRDDDDMEMDEAEDSGVVKQSRTNGKGKKSINDVVADEDDYEFEDL